MNDLDKKANQDIINATADVYSATAVANALAVLSQHLLYSLKTKGMNDLVDQIHNSVIKDIDKMSFEGGDSSQYAKAHDAAKEAIKVAFERADADFKRWQTNQS